MDTEGFDFVLGTDFFIQHAQVQSLTLQAPDVLHVDHGDGRESVPLEQSEHTSSYLRVCNEETSAKMVASKTEDYQLLWGVLDQGLKELGYSREGLNVELFASGKQHVLDLYCREGQNCCYKFSLALFRDGLGEPQVKRTWGGLDRGGPRAIPYVAVFPRLGSPSLGNRFAHVDGDTSVQPV